MGMLDDENASSLMNATQQFITTSPRNFNILSIDLSKVTQITSATAVVMKQLAEEAAKGNWQLRYHGASDGVQNVLKHAKALHLLSGEASS
jgi:ABC-type transporter Mla MlaB component